MKKKKKKKEDEVVRFIIYNWRFFARCLRNLYKHNKSMMMVMMMQMKMRFHLFNLNNDSNNEETKKKKTVKKFARCTFFMVLVLPQASLPFPPLFLISFLFFLFILNIYYFTLLISSMQINNEQFYMKIICKSNK